MFVTFGWVGGRPTKQRRLLWFQLAMLVAALSACSSVKLERDCPNVSELMTSAKRAYFGLDECDGAGSPEDVSRCRGEAVATARGLLGRALQCSDGTKERANTLALLGLIENTAGHRSRALTYLEEADVLDPGNAAVKANRFILDFTSAVDSKDPVAMTSLVGQILGMQRNGEYVRGMYTCLLLLAKEIGDKDAMRIGLEGMIKWGEADQHTISVLRGSAEVPSSPLERADSE